MLNILINIIIPVVILTRFSGEDQLGPVRGFVLALSFPLLFGIYSLVRERRIGFTPALGIIGVLLTGGIGLFQLDPKWVAIKEASVPLVLGLAILASRWTRFSLAKLFVDKVMDGPRVQAALEQKGTTHLFERQIVRVSYMLAGAFFLSATLNYVLAKVVVVSQPGTTAFNQELGRMTALSFPVITLPVMTVLIVTLFLLIRGTMKLTDLDMESIFIQQSKKAPDGQAEGQA